MQSLRSLRWLGPALSSVALAWACNTPPTALDAAHSDVSQTNGPADGGATATGLPCAVSNVLSKQCQTCHDSQPKSGASTSLVTYDDLQKDFNGKKVYELVETLIHRDSGSGGMPPAGKLSDADLGAIDDWVRGGAKSSSEQCGAAAPPAPTEPFVCDAPAKITTLKAATPFTWTDMSETDKYICFGFDETASVKRHGIALGPMIQNLQIIHHILVYQAPDSVPSEPTTCSAVMTGTWKLINGWAPGEGNFELPPEAGYPIAGTTHWVVQIHYNNTRALTGQSDNSGFQICETEQLRPYDAGMLAFGSTRFTIPPRTPSFTVKCDYKLDDRYKGVKFFSGKPHMHTLGRSISTHRIPGGTGAPELVIEQNPFVFEDQKPHPMDVTVSPGDVMHTECNWANPTDNEVTWGENTSDEMCFDMLSYYPAIPDDSILGVVPTQSWISPSSPLPLVGADCTSE
jgi:mono/diheme cytochrome c family protein